MPAFNLGVWTEREGGDWEACVISSYLEALVYGGVTAFPLGVYTQPEREMLEAVKDEPQDYATTDTASKARYGVQLRPLSVGTVYGALTRPGMGILLAGKGGLNIPTNAPIHSIFWVGDPAGGGSVTRGLVYDPLAANQSAGVWTPVAKVTAWALGAGRNQAREVRKDEFLPAVPPEPPKLYTQQELDDAVDKAAHAVAAAAVTEAGKQKGGGTL